MASSISFQKKDLMDLIYRCIYGRLVINNQRMFNSPRRRPESFSLYPERSCVCPERSYVSLSLGWSVTPNFSLLCRHSTQFLTFPRLHSTSSTWASHLYKSGTPHCFASTRRKRVTSKKEKEARNWKKYGGWGTIESNYFQPYFNYV